MGLARDRPKSSKARLLTSSHDRFSKCWNSGQVVPPREEGCGSQRCSHETLKELLLDHGPPGGADCEQPRSNEHRLHSSCEGKGGGRQPADMFLALEIPRNRNSSPAPSSPCSAEPFLLLRSQQDDLSIRQLVPSSHSPDYPERRRTARKRRRTCTLPQRSRARSSRHAPVDIVLPPSVRVER